MPWRVRLNSVMPSDSSSSMMARLRLGLADVRFSAALLMMEGPLHLHGVSGYAGYSWRPSLLSLPGGWKSMYAHCSTTRLGGAQIPTGPPTGRAVARGLARPQPRPPNSPSKTTSPAEITRLSA